MDSKFIITRERRILRPGDFFSWSPRSSYIRRVDSITSSRLFFTDIRYHNKDVNYSCSAFHLPFLYGYICRPR